MANSTLQVTYKTKKTGTGTQDLNKELKSASLSLTDLKSVIDMAVGAFQTVAAAAQSVINPVVDYAAEIRTLGRTIGSTAEESSKLIQAADDVGISAGTLQSAMEAAIKKGVSPTIEGISALSEEYLAIQDPIARTKFLMDKFGKSGADLGPLMEQGAAGIRAAGDAAEVAGLVMSEQAVQAARDYEIAMDDLEDSSLALKITLTEKLLPGVIGIIDAMSTQANLTRVWNEAQEAGIVTGEEWGAVHYAIAGGFTSEAEVLAELNTKLADYKTQLEEVDPAVQNMRLAAAAVKAAQVEETAAIDDTSAAVSRFNAILAGAVGNELARYEESQGDIQEKIAATRAELEKYTRLNGQTVTVITDTVQAQQNLTIALAEQETAAGGLAEAQRTLAENTDPEKQLQLEAAVARAQQAFGGAQGQVGEWNAALAESGGTYVTDYTKKINEITGELYTLEEAAAANAAAHEEATERILFGYLQQALAVDGLTRDEIKALTSVAGQWGLLDQATVTAVDGILDAADDLANGGSMAAFENQVNGVRDAILGVPTDIPVTFHVNTTGQMPSFTNNGGNANAFAGGADFTVPPGYPNDSFPMFVQSGEHVQVTPAGQSNGGGGDTYNVTINAPGATANELYDLIQANDIRRRTGARS